MDRTKKQSQSGNRTKAESQKAHRKHPPEGSEAPKKPTPKAGYPKIDLPDFTIEEKWIISGLFLFSLLLRLFFMNDGLFHYDSVDFAIQAERTVEELKIHYAHGMGFPGMAILNGLAYGTDALIRGTQSAELSITLLSIIFGAAAVVIFYLFTKELTQDRFIAFTAALLFSITPLFLSVTTFALSHGASVFFSLLAIYLFQKSEQKEQRWRYRLIILSGLTLGFAVTIRITNVLYAALILLLYFNPKFEQRELILEKPKIKEIILTGVLFITPLILTFLLLYWPKISTAGLGFITATAESVKWLGIYSQMTLFLLNWLNSSVILLGWILMLGGLVYSLKAKRYSIILLAWFVIFAIYFLNLSGTVSPRHLIPLLIPVYIYIATALEWVKSKNKLVAAVIIVILVLAMLIPVYPILEFRTQYCGPKEFAYYVQQNTEPDSVVIAVDEWIHLKYYANRTTLTHTQDGNDTKILEFLDRIDNYLDNNTPVYIVETGFSYDPGQKIQKSIVTNYNLTLIGSHLNEDYHKKAMFDGRFEERLFKIQHLE